MAQPPTFRFKRSEGSLDLLLGPRADAGAGGETGPAAGVQAQANRGEEQQAGDLRYASGGGD